MPDVLIAGGGVAGSSLAIMLGRQGLAVELFEAGSFPREKPCGEGLMPAGVGVLERLGLDQAVGGTPFHGIRYHIDGVTAEGRFPSVAGLPKTGRGQRRWHLDRVLFEAAAATPGVQAHTQARVTSPIVANGRVVGLCVEGEPRYAPLAVAADGRHSPLRRQVGLDLRLRRKRFGIRAHFRLAPGQPHPPWVEIFVTRQCEIYTAPLPERELLVALLADGENGGGPAERLFARKVFGLPALAARLEGAEQITPILCTSPLAARARNGVVPGIVLLGDAAGFIDPITGGGMAQALLTAELLAAHSRRGMAACPQWIRTFERDRHVLLRDYHILTRAVLWLADHPRLSRGLLPWLQRSPSLFSHLIGVAGGVRHLLPTLNNWTAEAIRLNQTGREAARAGLADLD